MTVMMDGKLICCVCEQLAGTRANGYLYKFGQQHQNFFKLQLLGQPICRSCYNQAYSTYQPSGLLRGRPARFVAGKRTASKPKNVEATDLQPLQNAVMAMLALSVAAPPPPPPPPPTTTTAPCSKKRKNKEPTQKQKLQKIYDAGKEAVQNEAYRQGFAQTKLKSLHVELDNESFVLEDSCISASDLEKVIMIFFFSPLVIEFI